MTSTTLHKLGASKSDLDTPFLALDLDKLDANIHRMAAACRAHGVAWRPHSKAHKSPDIARRLVASGAIGVTCAKLGEAEVMAEGGIRDLLIANQVVGPHKVRRVVELCRSADPIVTFDSRAQVDPLAQAAAAAGVAPRAIVEVDIGLNRAGVAPGEPTVALARHIARQPGLRFAGIMGYEGHLVAIEDPSEKSSTIKQAIGELVETKDQIERAGIRCEIVSAAGTGSYATTIACPGVTELQAGGLIFMDAFYRTKCRVDEFEFALSVVSTVVSRPTPDRAIIDAGRKTQFAETCPPIFVGREGVSLARLSAEHGQLELAPAARDLAIGDRVEFIPGYSDFTTVLHNEFLVFQDGKLAAIWPLAARGKLT